MKSMQCELDPIEDQGHDGAPRGLWKGHSDGFQDRTELRVPFVEVARDQELHGGAPPELEGLLDRGSGGRGEVFPRRLRAAPGVRQCIREPRSELARRYVCPRLQVQGQAVQLGGAVEGQGLRRLRRRLSVIHPRALVLPRPMKVDGQDLGIGPGRGLQHLREASVVALELRRRDVGDHGLADAVVVGLDFVVLGRPGAADQPARPQEVKCLLFAGA
jgi:hypothetical protein